MESVIGFELDVGHDLGLDLQGGKAYLIDATSRTIRGTTLDGSSVETAVSRPRRSDGIALDIGGGQYWTDRNAGKTRRSNLDDSRVQAVITGLPYPQSIAFHSLERMIYLDRTGCTGTIGRERTKGSGMGVVVDSVLRGGPVGLTIVVSRLNPQ